MARVLKIACGLMGVLLLVMVGVIGVGRYGKDEPTAMAIVVGRGWYTEAMYLVYPGSTTSIERQISPRLSRLIVASADENSFYFYGGEKPYQKLYHVGWDGDGLTVIAGDTFSNLQYRLWMLNDGWILFMQGVEENGDFNGALFRVYQDGSGLERLTPSGLDVRGDSVFLSPSQTSIAFLGWRDSGAFYLMGTDGSDLHVVVSQNTMGTVTNTFRWPANSPYLYVQVSQMNQDYLGRIHTETDWLESIPLRDGENVIRRFIELLSAQNLLLTSDTEAPHWREANLTAFTLDSLKSLWALPNSAYLGISPDGQWLILSHYHPDETSIFGYKADIEKMRLDGNERQVLVKDLEDPSIWSYSPDGKWIIFQTNHGAGRFKLWRVPVEGGEPEYLRDMRQGTHLVTWSPGGEWLYFREFTDKDRRPGSDIYRIRVDGSGYQKIKLDGDEAYFSQWVKLPLMSFHPPHPCRPCPDPDLDAHVAPPPAPPIIFDLSPCPSMLD